MRRRVLFLWRVLGPTVYTFPTNAILRRQYSITQKKQQQRFRALKSMLNKKLIRKPTKCMTVCVSPKEKRLLQLLRTRRQSSFLFRLPHGSTKRHGTLFNQRFKKRKSGIVVKYPTIQALAYLGGSVGCAVRLETMRSRVQPPPRSATLFRGD